MWIRAWIVGILLLAALGNAGPSLQAYYRSYRALDGHRRLNSLDRLILTVMLAETKSAAKPR